MQKPAHRNTRWIVVGIIALLVVASIAALLLRQQKDSDRMAALISVNGADLSTIDLSLPSNYQLSLFETTGVEMVLEIKDHAIRVLHASCPDQVCVKAGWLAHDMDIAICMPNRVSVVIAPWKEIATMRTEQP